jgi:spore germination protein
MDRQGRAKPGKSRPDVRKPPAAGGIVRTKPDSEREDWAMTGDRDKITSNQLMAIMISLLIGIGILSLPRTVTEEAGPDGWLLVLAGGIIVIIISVIISKLGIMFSGQTVVEYSKAVVTKPLGILFSLGLFVYFVFFTAFEARVFSEITKQFLLDRTPTEAIVVTILISSTYLVRQDLATIGRMGEMLVPVFIIIPFLFLIPAIPEMDLTNLLPFMGTSPVRLLAGMGTIVTSYLGFETLLLFQPLMSRPQDAGKAMAVAMTAVMLVYILMVIATVSIFGVFEVQRLIWPTFSVFRAIKIPGAFMENVHGVIMAIWVVTVYMTLSIFFFAGVTTMGRLLALKEHSFMVLPLAFIIYFLAMMPDNIAVLYEYLDMFSIYLGVPFGFVLPLVIYITARVRGMGKERGKKDGKHPKKSN